MFPINVPEVQFYINNTCNLSCSNCLSFNNFNLKGYFKYKDYKTKNELWPKYIYPNRVSILGGEPYLNPDFENWMINVRKLWPTHNNMTISTNGTLFHKLKYKNLAKKSIENNYLLEVAVHYEKDFDNIYRNVNEILQELKINYRIKDVDPNDLYENKIVFYSESTNKHLIYLYRKYYFIKNSITSYNQKTIKFHSNDAKTVHENCPAKTCHYIVQGNLYKCPVVGTGHLFAKQYTLLDENLFEKYESCDPTIDESLIEHFLRVKIKNYIPQCKLCPSSHALEKII